MLEVGQFTDEADDGRQITRLGMAQDEGVRVVHDPIVARPTAAPGALAYSRPDEHVGRLSPSPNGPERVRLPSRGLKYHVHRWGDASLVSSGRPALVLMHGWMDVGASFQFVVDALAEADGFDRLVLGARLAGASG